MQPHPIFSYMSMRPPCQNPADKSKLHPQRWAQQATPCHIFYLPTCAHIAEGAAVVALATHMGQSGSTRCTHCNILDLSPLAGFTACIRICKLVKPDCTKRTCVIYICSAWGLRLHARRPSKLSPTSSGHLMRVTQSTHVCMYRHTPHTQPYMNANNTTCNLCRLDKHCRWGGFVARGVSEIIKIINIIAGLPTIAKATCQYALAMCMSVCKTTPEGPAEPSLPSKARAACIWMQRRLCGPTGTDWVNHASLCVLQLCSYGNVPQQHNIAAT